MALKNFTTKISAEQSMGEIQKMLAVRGATGVIFDYEQGTGRIEQMLFKLELAGNTIGFRLPLKWRECATAIAKDESVPGGYRRRAKTDEDYAYRVAWRILRDWVAAQVAVIDVSMVKIDQVFLPYAVQGNGKTIYESLEADPSRLLAAG